MLWEVRLNGNSRLLSGLAYETCAEAGGTIAEHDELEFLSPTVGAWTFQARADARCVVKQSRTRVSGCSE